MKIVLFFLALVVGGTTLIAQEPEIDTKATIELLHKRLEQIEQEEKKALKKQVEDINSLFENGVVGEEEADRLKLKAAEGRAQTIEKRQASVLETIAFLEKKNKSTSKKVGDVPIFLDIDSYIEESEETPEVEKNRATRLRVEEPQSESQAAINTEIRSPTTLDLVFATGLNNIVREGITWSDLEDETDYLFYSSRFLEIGFTLKTPLVEKNGLRIKYGLSLQFNELEPNGNRAFTEVDGQTILEEFPNRLYKSSFLVSNLVFPVHLEFGPTKRKYNLKGGYYSASNQFKIGVGGYIGLNLNARQKLLGTAVFRGRRFLTAQTTDGFDVNNEIYGVSAYIGFGAFSVYGKYDLNYIFANGVSDEQFVSVGLRIDL